MPGKDYSMSFNLNASMGNVSGVFGKAQREIAAMQKEITALNKAQGDIAAYQKQQRAVEASAGKVSILRQQYANLEQEGRKAGESEAEFANRLLDQQMKIDKAAAALENEQQKLSALSQRLKAAGVDTSKLDEEIARLNSELQTLQKRQEDAADGSDKFADKLASGMDAAAAAIAAAGIVAGLQKIAEGLKDCIDAAAEFEATMSTVEAISGANADQMAALSAEAKALGASTKYTATEAGEAMTYMAMAGWKAEEMLSGMSGVLNLAAASGEDLASVSDIVTDNLTAFGLSARDTAHFADVLAAASSNANTSVGIMGETFKKSAPLAGALGYSIEDVAVATGLMANAGVKGSNAGTALQNMFTNLLGEITLTGAALGEVTYSTINADGSMKSFGQTMADLRGYFEQMTGAEKLMNAEALVGKRAMAGFVDIMAASQSDFDKLTDAINNSAGAAQRMADIKMDNLRGQATLAQSAFDALKVTLGEQFEPEMRRAYELMTDASNAMNRFVSENPAVVKAITAFVAVVGTATAALTAYAAIVKIVKALELGTLFGGVGGIILGVAAAVGVVTAAIVGYNAALNEGIPTVRELTTASSALQETMSGAADSIASSMDEVKAAGQVADRYIDRLEAMGDYASLNAAQQQEYRNVLSLLCETVPDLSGLIDVQTGAIDGGTDALRANTAAWEANAAAQAREQSMAEIYAAHAKAELELQKNTIGLTRAEANLTLAQEKRSGIQKRMGELYQEAADYAAQQERVFGYAQDATQYLSAEYYELSDALSEATLEERRAQNEVNNYKAAVEEGTIAVANASEEVSLYQAALDALAESEGTDSERQAELKAEIQEVSTAIQTAKEKAEELATAYNEAYKAAYESVHGQYDIWDEAAKVAATSTATITGNLEGQAQYWTDYNDNLAALGARTKDIEGLQEMLASFADGSKESVDAVAGMATASDADLKKMVASWKTVQEAQKAVSESLAQLKTDFDTQMDALAAGLAADIEAMNLSGEAASAARSTISSYISAAAGMKDDVAKAFAALAAAAAGALSGGDGGDDGGGVNMNPHQSATGTYNAQRGVTLVGEQGPELVWLNGGERVVNARESAALLAQAQTSAASVPALAELPMPEQTSGGGGISINVTFQIDGPVTEGSVEALRDYGDEFAERVLAVIADADDDASRRRYA